MMRLLLGAALLAAAAPALAGDYTLFVYERPADLAVRTDPARAPAYWASYQAFGDAAKAAGVMRGGAPLDLGVPGSAAGPVRATSAPVQLTGYFIIAADSLADATAWAKRIPAAATARVEVRANLPVAMAAPR